ncbi:MAG TPA: hypothetical protein VLT36_08715, partial [Candidatus Dormibacteraeota bacterium]|nr:hypothetical protein [Candidatus Dormibacteraeota bacterium]
MPPQVAYFVVLFLAGASSLVSAADWQTGPGYRFQPLPVPAGGHSGFSLLTAAETGITFSNLVPAEMHLTNHVFLDG